MSAGLDEIPQFIYKNHANTLCDTLTVIFNTFAKNGLTQDLKTAQVTAIHKKGCKKDVTNYRPISNLSSMAKIYEKCILKKLEVETDGLEGEHQHGFRRNHSTETALLTLQSIIANKIEKKQMSILYSIDLSGAFDLLRPDVFTDSMKNTLSEGLLFCLNDFLLDRKFRVKYYNHFSQTIEIDRGCVQGSILGPKLFNLYLRELAIIKDENTDIVTYADDTYIVISGPSANLPKIVEETIKKQTSILKKFGMCVNKSKTEVMWIGNKNNKEPGIIVCNNLVPFQNQIKALGVTISHDLSWELHASNVISKGKKLLSALYHTRKYLTESQFLRSVANNFSSTVFYASTVWFDNLKKVHAKKI